MSSALFAGRGRSSRLITGGLVTILAVIVFLASPLGAAEPPGKPNKPIRNVLWICADDLAAYACGPYGRPLARTPQLDKFAATAMRFDRAYCNSPVCTASRQSFLTGKYPANDGVRVLKDVLSDDELTLAEMLAEHAYETAAIGKMHFNSDRTHDFQRLTDLADHRRWLSTQPAERFDPEKVLGPWKPFKDHARIWLNADCRPYAARRRLMAGAWLAGEAVQFLEAAHPQPFFLMVSFYEPHSPFHFPVDLAGTRTPDEFAAPKVAPQDSWQVPAIFRELLEDDRQGIAAAYYTSVAFLDENVGRVLDALAKGGHVEDTLVVFNGDHGYLLGEHGRFEKHCSFEEAIRPPLLVRAPGVTTSNSSTTAMVELVDIVPTILELCGFPLPASVEGHSFAAVLKSPALKHRDFVIAEYAENEEVAIRDSNWKLVYSSGQRQRQDGYATGEPLPGRTIRLYDEQADPQELDNLAEQPAQAERVKALLGNLVAHYRELESRHLKPGEQPFAEPKDDVAAMCDALDLYLRPSEPGSK